MLYHVCVAPAFPDDESVDVIVTATSKARAIASAIADRYGVSPESVLYMTDFDGLLNIIISGQKPFMTQHKTIDSMAQDIGDKARRIVSAKEGE